MIGGGPGGAMAGTLLADAGKQVILLEAAKFPRYHIGESLLSGTADLLQRIGVLNRLEDEGYIKKHGVQWIWGESREPWTVYFKDALAMPYDYGYQVERDAFDKMLLDNAREHGVDVREQHRVTDFALDDAGALVTYRDAAGATATVRARWIVDASGQGGTVTKRLHQQQWDPYLKNLAVWSYWRGAERPPGLDAGNTFLPAFDDGWWWFIPLRDDITSVGAVVDSEVLHRHREAGMTAYYADCLARTPELAERLRDAEMVDEVRVARDWSYSYDRFAGEGYIAVGDAACFIDPLFSTGVHLAMLSGFLAAATVNTVLDKRELDRSRVLDFYETAYRKEFARLRAQVYFLYGGHGADKDSYFWHARSQFDVPGIAPEKAFISLIAGAFQHRSWYSRYLRHLDVPNELRSTIEQIFDGKSTGLGVDPQQPLFRSRTYSITEELAVDGAYLRLAQSVQSRDGISLPLTEPLESLLAMADGATSIQLVDRLVEHGQSRDMAHSMVHEAVSYGFLVPHSDDSLESTGTLNS
ncbi:clorobiocin biosynthesis protein Clo-hal/halogenation protein CepH [Micromonospora sp. Llam0]|uniref:tryptophan 7-halogenase n=1 Tax=Micromonospora sp. Llam0 TaxID=2485143 RepID=UPI000FA6A401|nr:tryptophan 7-halogenase [Micromonospora sp. Llam0]ROO50966.1 clorobiocin biosynthesis protein Clo-hal/halogenation protein CepH [Micromonospora sp. Llam0]